MFDEFCRVFFLFYIFCLFLLPLNVNRGFTIILRKSHSVRQFPILDFPVRQFPVRLGLSFSGPSSLASPAGSD